MDQGLILITTGLSIDPGTSGFAEALDGPLGTGRWTIFGLTTHCGDALKT